jgi:8-oxo-dGTP pyrophosphatase MutT (NUDIX family)
MADYEKVLAYVIRARDGRADLLVFTHRDHPAAGVQVPAGTVEPGEAIADAVCRELTEESGLAPLGPPRLLHEYVWQHPRTGDRHHRHVFVFTASDALPEQWQHTATGSEEEDGLVFCFRWLSLSDAERLLCGGQGASIAKLREVLRKNFVI